MVNPEKLDVFSVFVTIEDPIREDTCRLLAATIVLPVNVDTINELVVNV